jgi:hypothetical protein
MEILAFIVMVFASLLDPIRTPGFIISGWVIKNLLGAVVVSILWNVLLYAVIIAPLAAREHSSPRSDVFLASCVGATLMTGITFFFASRRRKAKLAERMNPDEDKPDD